MRDVLETFFEEEKSPYYAQVFTDINHITIYVRKDLDSPPSIDEVLSVLTSTTSEPLTILNTEGSLTLRRQDGIIGEILPINIF